MGESKNSEKRKYPRIESNFVVSYRVKQVLDKYDLTQTKTVSQGGLLLTTKKKFDKGAILSVTVRFPFTSTRIKLTGRVVDSKEMAKDCIYDTRIEFIDLDEKFFEELGQFVKKYSK